MISTLKSIEFEVQSSNNPPHTHYKLFHSCYESIATLNSLAIFSKLWTMFVYSKFTVNDDVRVDNVLCVSRQSTLWCIEQIYNALVIRVSIYIEMAKIRILHLIIGHTDCVLCKFFVCLNILYLFMNIVNGNLYG